MCYSARRRQACRAYWMACGRPCSRRRPQRVSVAAGVLAPPCFANKRSNAPPMVHAYTQRASVPMYSGSSLACTGRLSRSKERRAGVATNRYPLKLPVRYANDAIEICRFHNYSPAGCIRGKLPCCPLPTRFAAEASLPAWSNSRLCFRPML